MSDFSCRHGWKVYRLEGPEMLIPRNHARKIWPRFVGAILRGEKAFELRQEDRARFEPARQPRRARLRPGRALCADLFHVRSPS